ncbi:MAG: alpha/beta fold hydrolase [Nitriliruptorales bacterium]|nr:alpha/beta fold hydrolase [Nitriliruptorales bacterium]
MGITSVMAGAEPWSAEGSGDRARVGVAVIHGFTGNPVSTRPVGERLNAEGWTVEVPRLPGHGTSWMDLSRTRFGDWRRVVDETIDSLAERCDKVVVVGLSMGGTLTLDAATRRPADLAAIAVINATILPRDGLLPKLLPVLQFLLPVTPRDLADMPTGDIAKEGGDERAYGLVPTMTAYSIVKAQDEIRGRLDRLTMPVLVAWSPQDHTVPPKNSEWLAEQLADRDLTTVRCERSYHVVTLDHDAELLNDALVDFVARTTDS